MRSHPLALLRLSDDEGNSGETTAGAPLGIGGAPPLPPPPTWRASKRSWRVPPPNAETWRLLNGLPQRLRHGILSMADSLERLSEPIAASEAPSLVRRVSRLSSWHRTAARTATLRLLVYWQPRWGQQSVDTAFGAFRDPPHPTASVYNVCVEAPVPFLGSGVYPLDALPQLVAAKAPGNPGLPSIVNDLALASVGEDGSETPQAYRAVFRASHMPELPRLRTLRLLFFRRIYLAGLSPTVRKVNIYLSRQLAGERLAPLGSLTAHTLADLHVTANYSSLPQDEVILDVEQMCRSARNISINVRALGLPVPPPRLQQRVLEAAVEPAAAWSVGIGASVWDLGVPMPAPGGALPGTAPLSAVDLKPACLARIQRWVLEGAAEYVEVLCKHVRFHYASDGSGQLVPLPPHQVSAVANESWAQGADALALDLANAGASVEDVEDWVTAATLAYQDAQAGGAGGAERSQLFEVDAAWRLDQAVLRHDLQQWQEQRERREWQERQSDDSEPVDEFGQPLTGLNRTLERALRRVAPPMCGALIVALLALALKCVVSKGDERYDEDPVRRNNQQMEHTCGRMRRGRRA